jgi:Tol biopolymer transport system component
MTNTFSRLFFALTLLSAVSFAADHKTKVLDKETYFQMESITNPSISPDGSQIVFSRGWADVMKDQEQANLWLVDINGQRPRELTQGAWRDSAAAWSTDGKRIAFLSDRSGTRQIHVMWIDTHEVSQLTHLERAPANLRWSPDGKWIAFTAAIPDETNLLPVRCYRGPFKLGPRRLRSNGQRVQPRVRCRFRARWHAAPNHARKLQP